jgi:hypothetical protein
MVSCSVDWRKGEHTARGARTSIARLLGLLVITAAEIIGAAVYDDGALFLCQQHLDSFFALLPPDCKKSEREEKSNIAYPQYALWANQLDQPISDGPHGIALRISFDVAQVAHVAHIIGGGAVSGAVGINWRKLIVSLAAAWLDN